MTVFLSDRFKDNEFFSMNEIDSSKVHTTSEMVYITAHSEEVLINSEKDVIHYQGSLPPQENG